ncbi:MAG: hypothetical protein WBD66_06255 [Candidatus Acidiferrales bacterium]
MRPLFRSCLITMVSAALMGLPAMGASEKPLGMVIQAQSALLETAQAQMGATVYAGDAMSTDSGGSLRLKVGNGQVYLLSSSAMRLAEIDGAVQATVKSGTVGFSSGPNSPVVLETPEGIVKSADGRPAYGQVTLTGPNQMVISAYTGDLLVEYAGQVEEINAGNSYTVTMEPGPAPQNGQGSGTHASVNNHIVVKIVAAAVVGVLAYVSYHELCESPSKVK